jgi:hypothetical protein
MCELIITHNSKRIKFSYDGLSSAEATDMKLPNICKWIRLIHNGDAIVEFCNHPVSIDRFAEDFNNALLFSLIPQTMRG